MKKLIASAALIMLLAGLASGCGGQDTGLPDMAEPTPPELPVATGEPADKTEAVTPTETEDSAGQIDIIVENIELWAYEAEYANEVYAYTVTDLDQNGRLELLAAHHGGSGDYTYIGLYEVSEDRTELDVCVVDIPEGMSQPDIIMEGAQVYRDPADGVLRYIVKDHVKISAGEEYEFTEALSFTDGVLRVEQLAYFHRVYAEDGSVAEEYFRGEETITAAEYSGIAETVFSGMERLDAYFMWYSSTVEPGIDKHEPAAAAMVLSGCYSQFSVE